MQSRERNNTIKDYLESNPIDKGKVNCYHDVCEKFHVNKDVIKGIIRHDKSGRVFVINNEVDAKSYQVPSNTTVSTDYSTGTISIQSTLDEEIKSIEDFVKSNKIDLNKYEIVSAKNSTWQSGVNQKYSVSLNLKPKVSNISGQSVDEILKDFFKKNPSPKVFDTSACSTNGDTFLNVYMSDLHFGAMPTDECLYENPYNKDIIKNRFEYLVSYLVNKKNKNGKYKDLFLVNLGDTLDGFNHSTARGGHFLPQNLSNKNQFEEYFSCMRNLFESIVKNGIADNIHFYSVGDSNHDGDLQYIVNRTVEIWLNSTYPKIETKVFKKFLGHYEHNNHTFIITHGKDKDNMKSGFPLHLDLKTESRINDYISVNNLTGLIHVIKGDLHQSACEYGKRFRYKNCMSLVGTTDYSAVNYGSFYSGFDFDEFDEFGTLVEPKLFFRHHFNNK